MTLLCTHIGMHVIEETDAFTLVGAGAKLGKLTLFVADGPRRSGVLERVALRVQDLDATLADLPVSAQACAGALVEAPEGLRLALVENGGVHGDLDHVVLRVPDPAPVAAAFTAMGFERRGDHLAVADREVRLERGRSDDGGRPLLFNPRGACRLGPGGAGDGRAARARGGRRQGRPEHLRRLPARSVGRAS